MKNKKTLLLEFSKINNIDFNIVLKYYVFERLLYRLSRSKYNNILILKGGFFLFAYTNIYQRVTRDIDFTIMDYDLSLNNVKNIINELISIKCDDDILFVLDDIDFININREYYGLRIKLSFRIFNISDSIHIDLATGDVITPSALKTKYHSFINDESFDLYSYNIETYISEKLETILSKLENNSRMKDFYDIYLLNQLYQNNINKKVLKKAIKNTFNNRNFNSNVHDSIYIIKNSNVLRKYWSIYKTKNRFANNIEYDEIIDVISNYALYINNNYKKARLNLSFV